MAILHPILSTIHVLGAVIWGGWAFAFLWFINPAAKESGESGSGFMQRLMNGPVLKVLMIAPLLVVLSGLILYWFYTGHLNTGIIFTFRGIALTIGALAGIAAFLEGMFVTGPAADKMEKLGTAMKQAGGPPTSDQLAEMGRLQQKLEKAATRSAYFLLVAVIGMAIGG